MSQTSNKIWSIVFKTVTYILTAIAGAFGFETFIN